jgi:hypothetical protein
MQARVNELAMAMACVLTLSACGAPQEATPEGSVPSSCEVAEVISAFDQMVEGAIYIPTDWEPAEGTDLYKVYEAGGIACTYGIESAEIGGTVMWAMTGDELWTEMSSEWKEADYVAVDIPDLEEHEAFVLETLAADDQPVLFVNFHIHGVWVQFGASKFVSSLEDALQIIHAAASATSPK